MKGIGYYMISTFFALLAFSFITNYPHNFEECFEKNSSFSNGEELVYRVYYNWKIVWIPAGEVRFKVYEKEDEYKLEAVGKSYASYDNFFRVRDYYSTTVDRTTMRPKTFVRRIEEGNYRKFDSLYFDQDHNKLISFNGKTREVAKEREFDIDPCTLDLLSVLYSLRNTHVEDYKPGDYLDIEMFMDEEKYPIHVIYESKEVKKIKELGEYPTLKIRPELIAGNVFKEGDIMNIWVSDDKNKIPLLIESPISIGSVKAVLKKYSGLRNATVLDKL